MPIGTEILSSLASDYAKGMTSIRGRRVQRLLKREFAGAEYVLIMQVGSGAAGVLGLSANGVAFCATDGRGKHASIVKWLHESREAFESQIDLLKDTLPVLDTKRVPLTDPLSQGCLRISAGSVPPQARALVSMARQVLVATPEDVPTHRSSGPPRGR